MWVRLTKEELQAEEAERRAACLRVGPPLLGATFFTLGIVALSAAGVSPRLMAILPRGPFASELLRASPVAPLLFVGAFWALFHLRRTKGWPELPDAGGTLLCTSCFEPAAAEAGTACACGGEREPIARFRWSEGGTSPRPPVIASPWLSSPARRRVAMALSIVAAVAGALGLVLVRVATGAPSGVGSPPEAARDLDSAMRELAAQAVIDARERHGVVLDFTPASIRDVERVLAASSEAARSMEPRDAGGLALVYGAYVGEVIRREKGGAWARDHHAAGTDTFPLEWGGRASFPYGWCRKRLLQGPEEDVFVKYEWFVHGRELPGVTIEAERVDLPGGRATAAPAATPAEE